MTKIFISYRRDDSADNTYMIVQHLTEISGRFKPEDVFFDVESIPVGVNFRQYIDERIAQCVVVLVIMGPDWASITDAKGQRRLHLVDDQVRIEVEIALRRKTAVIPVWVRDARVPYRDDLPESIRAVVDYNGVQIRRPPDFKNDMARLVTALERLIENAAKPKPSPPPVSPPPVPQPQQTVQAPRPVSSAPYHPLRILSGHAGGVFGVDVSPDGNLIVSASGDKTLKLWDMHSGREIYTLSSHAGHVNACQFSPDGRLIVSASSDFTLKLWDVATGKAISTMKGHTDLALDCAFSPDGKQVVSASTDNTIRFWDVLSGRSRVLKAHKNQVTCCAFSPDGASVLTGSLDTTLILWRAENGRKLRALNDPDRASVYGCAFSPDGHLFASGASSNRLKIWDIADGVPRLTLLGHTYYVNDCAFSPDGKRLISGSLDSTMRLWEVSTGALLHTFTEHSGNVSSCRFSPDGQYLISGGDKRVIIWGALRR